MREGRLPKDDVVEVWRASLDQPDHVRERLARLLDAGELVRASTFRFDLHRNRYVVGRGLLRVLLGRYLERDPAGFRFGYGPQRKPELPGGELRFNLAHAESTALYAFSSAFEVGIDVELRREEAASDGVAERFFSPAEVAVLRSLPERVRPLAFFNCWTRKEAFLKARGDGLTIPLESFDVTLAPGEPAALLATAWAPEEAARWQLADLSESRLGEIAALAAPARGWTCLRRDLDISTVVLN